MALSKSEPQELLWEITPVLASERFFLQVQPLLLDRDRLPLPAPLLRNPLNVLGVHEPASTCA